MKRRTQIDTILHVDAWIERYKVMNQVRMMRIVE